jgi:hypothetical protein
MSGGALTAAARTETKINPKALMLKSPSGYAARYEGKPFSLAGNFAIDIQPTEETIDTRAGTWGRSGSETKVLRFIDVPPGRRVRILRASGDLVCGVSLFTGGPEASEAREAWCGVLWSLHRHPREEPASIHADYAADDHFAYTQGAFTVEQPSRVPLEARGDDFEFLLGPTHELAFKMASWLDSTAGIVHLECTFSQLVCQYVEVI